jgi:hypothetical protein
MAPALSLSSRAPSACLSERDASAIGLCRSEGQFDLFESRLYIGFYVLSRFPVLWDIGLSLVVIYEYRS